MEDIFLENRKAPKNLHTLHTDMGLEFKNTNVKSLLDKYKINHYNTYTDLKALIVERFNRTPLSIEK